MAPVGPQLFEKGFDVRPVDRPEVGQAKRIEAGDLAGVDGEPSGAQVVVHRLDVNPPPLTVGGPPVPLTLRLDVADQMFKSDSPGFRPAASNSKPPVSTEAEAGRSRLQCKGELESTENAP